MKRIEYKVNRDGIFIIITTERLNIYKREKKKVFNQVYKT